MSVAVATRGFLPAGSDWSAGELRAARLVVRSATGRSESAVRQTLCGSILGKRKPPAASQRGQRPAMATRLKEAGSWIFAKHKTLGQDTQVRVTVVHSPLGGDRRNNGLLRWTQVWVNVQASGQGSTFVKPCSACLGLRYG